MTNHWIDIRNSDCILIMGSNAAEIHPISFKWVNKAMRRGAKLINVDPRFTRSSAKADIYAPLRSGTDIAFLGGMIKYIIENDKYFKPYVAEYTNAGFILEDSFSFDDGLFSGYDSKTRKYNKKTWAFKKAADGTPLKDHHFKIRDVSFSCSNSISAAMIMIKYHPSPEHPKKISRPYTRSIRQRGKGEKPVRSCTPWVGPSILWVSRIFGPWP